MKHPEFYIQPGYTIISLGILPTFLDEDDPRPTIEQLHANYAHGGGWHDFKGFTLSCPAGAYQIQYPEDPPMMEIARGRFREDIVILFESEWVAVVAPDSSYRIARMD